MPIEHSDIGLAEIHLVHNWEYANAAARTGASGFIASDVGKWAKQLDDGSFWELTATTPTWAQRTGAGALADGSVTNTKLADMATQTIKGRTTAGTGDPEDLTATQATAILNAVVGDSGAGGTKGLVPAPAAGDAAAGKFLKADGTFVVPSGTGAETGANSDITSMDGLTGALENPTQIIFPEAAAPATPGAAKVTLYAKTDGLLYSKDDAGAETLVSGGAGGGSIAPLTLIDANTVHQKNAGNSQVFSVFHTTTNNHRLSLQNVSGGFEIASQIDAGSPNNISIVIGSSKYLFATTALTPPTNQGQNLGASATRWAVIFGAQFNAKADDVIRWDASTKLNAPGDGWLNVAPNSGSNGKLSIGGSGSGNPMLKNNGTVMEVKVANDSNYTTLLARALSSNPVTVAQLPTGAEGMLVAVTDSSTATWGDTITGGGANKVLAYFNGTNWTVAAK